jgi:hypothetical protein
MRRQSACHASGRIVVMLNLVLEANGTTAIEPLDQDHCGLTPLRDQLHDRAVSHLTRGRLKQDDIADGNPFHGVILRDNRSSIAKIGSQAGAPGEWEAPNTGYCQCPGFLSIPKEPFCPTV